MQMSNKKQQTQSNSSNSPSNKESVKIQNQTSIYNFANATTISLMMREANRGAHIDTKIIENSLKQGRAR